MGFIKERLKLCKNFYRTYQYLVKLHQTRKQERQEEFFERNSAKIMEEIQMLIEKSGRKFYFAFGTLLGIIRDNKLLKHDMDIDMIMYCKDQDDIEKTKQFLCENGMIPVFEFSVDGIGIVQHAFDYKKIRVDMHYCTAKVDDTVDYVYVLFDDENEANKVARFACTHTTKETKHDFNGKIINVPEDPIAFIANMYGENWRIPDKNYKYWKSQCVDVLEARGSSKTYQS